MIALGWSKGWSWPTVTVMPTTWLVCPARTSIPWPAAPTALSWRGAADASVISVSTDQPLSSPRWSSHASWTFHPPDLPPRLCTISGQPFTWAVSIMKAWFQCAPSFLCSLLCGLMQIPNFNKQLLNMPLTLLGLQMRRCYLDYSVSYSFVMSFVTHSWPTVYRMELRLSPFFLWLSSFFFPQRITILLPKDWLLAHK